MNPLLRLVLALGYREGCISDWWVNNSPGQAGCRLQLRLRGMRSCRRQPAQFLHESEMNSLGALLTLKVMSSMDKLSVVSGMALHRG